MFTDRDPHDEDWMDWDWDWDFEEDDVQCSLSSEECGKHSGIPPCCRQFFEKVWAERVYDTTSFNSALEMPDWVNYIPCPGCRAVGAFVHLKPCPKK